MIRKFSIGYIAAVGLFTLSMTGVHAVSDHNESNGGDTNKILAAKFEPRQIVQIEAGKFYFKPWQIGPVHTHPAPCAGYIAKGAILFQIEGEKPQMLRAGDAYYEPTGPRIMRFDNASATGETIFIDICPEQKDEPFLVFEKEPTEFIDRRALPTITFERARTIKQIEVFEHILQPGGRINLENRQSLIAGYVAAGEIELRINNKVSQRVKAGEYFYQSSDSQVLLANTSSNVPAKVIAFNLQ